MGLLVSWCSEFEVPPSSGSTCWSFVSRSEGKTTQVEGGTPLPSLGTLPDTSLDSSGEFRFLELSLTDRGDSVKISRYSKFTDLRIQKDDETES